MRLVLKDKTEILINSMNDNYNPKISADEEKRSTTFTIVDPAENITIDYLSSLLTDENMSSAQIMSDEVNKNIEPCKVTNISESISDLSHSLLIRTTRV